METAIVAHITEVTARLSSRVRHTDRMRTIDCGRAHVTFSWLWQTRTGVEQEMTVLHHTTETSRQSSRTRAASTRHGSPVALQRRPYPARADGYRLPLEEAPGPSAFLLIRTCTRDRLPCASAALIRSEGPVHCGAGYRTKTFSRTAHAAFHTASPLPEHRHHGPH